MPAISTFAAVMHGSEVLGVVGAGSFAEEILAERKQHEAADQDTLENACP